MPDNQVARGIQFKSGRGLGAEPPYCVVVFNHFFAPILLVTRSKENFREFFFSFSQSSEMYADLSLIESGEKLNTIFFDKKIVFAYVSEHWASFGTKNLIWPLLKTGSFSRKYPNFPLHKLLKIIFKINNVDMEQEAGSVYDNILLNCVESTLVVKSEANTEPNPLFNDTKPNSLFNELESLVFSSSYPFANTSFATTLGNVSWKDTSVESNYENYFRKFQLNSLISSGRTNNLLYSNYYSTLNNCSNKLDLGFPSSQFQDSSQKNITSNLNEYSMNNSSLKVEFPKHESTEPLGKNEVGNNSLNYNNYSVNNTPIKSEFESPIGHNSNILQENNQSTDSIGYNNYAINNSANKFEFATSENTGSSDKFEFPASKHNGAPCYNDYSMYNGAIKSEFEYPVTQNSNNMVQGNEHSGDSSCYNNYETNNSTIKSELDYQNEADTLTKSEHEDFITESHDPDTFPECEQNLITDMISQRLDNQSPSKNKPFSEQIGFADIPENEEYPIYTPGGHDNSFLFLNDFIFYI